MKNFVAGESGAPAPTQPTPTYAEVLQALKAMYDGCPECGSAMCDHKGLSEVYSAALHVILEAERVGAPAPVQDSPTKPPGPKRRQELFAVERGDGEWVDAYDQGGFSVFGSLTEAQDCLDGEEPADESKIVRFVRVDSPTPNPFEPEETWDEQNRRVGRMIRENVDKRLRDSPTKREG